MNTLLLRRLDIDALLTIEECITAVENAFSLYAKGKAKPPGILGIHSAKGGFHIKAGILDTGKSYFASKTNSNFPLNPKEYGLPLIQGIIVVYDTENGRLLALMDSIGITIIRTGAATAVAAKYLARNDAKTAAIFGCGNQGRISLKALMKVKPVEKVYAYDIDKNKADEFAKELGAELRISIVPVDDPGPAARQSRICITCTPSSQPYLQRGDIMPGTFIAAVGADSEDKQELYPDLLASGKVITDLVEQCSHIGELHHAVKKNYMSVADVHAELGEIITGQKPGRESDEEIIIFDSTGIALQDVAAAAIVYEKAVAKGTGVQINFAAQNENNEQEHTKIINY